MFTKKDFINRLIMIVLSFLCVFLCRVYVIANNIPNKFYLVKGKEQTVVKDIPVSLITVNKQRNTNLKAFKDTFYINQPRMGEYSANFKLFGLIPFKNIVFKVMPAVNVAPGGNLIGIKIKNKGVIVVDTSKTELTNDSKMNYESPIRKGDILMKINDQNITDTKELSDAVEKSSGRSLNITIKRIEKIIQLKIKPYFDKKYKKYRIGLWVKDSAYGIGTMSFYDPKSKKYGALGHPIIDQDTGIYYDIDQGNIYNSTVVSVKKGTNGNPGELQGIFVNSDNPIGSIKENNSYGIYGDLFENIGSAGELPVAYSSEVQEGPAYILSTVENNKIQKFSINILRINRNDPETTKNMIIQITDKKLIDATGGIVQGMSGSPIIQNNKIVGAVTHVFINDSSKGFGIFSEYMLEKSNYFK